MSVPILGKHEAAEMQARRALNQANPQPPLGYIQMEMPDGSMQRIDTVSFIVNALNSLQGAMLGLTNLVEQVNAGLDVLSRDYRMANMDLHVVPEHELNVLEGSGDGLHPEMDSE